MRKIVFIMASTERGGAERQAFNLGKGLVDANKAEVLFVCYCENKNGLFLRDLRSNELSYVLLPAFKKIKYPKLRFIFRFFMLFRIIRILFSADILMPYTYDMNIYIGLIMRLNRSAKCVWNQRDEGLVGVSNICNYLAMKRYDYFIANSLSGANFLEKAIGINIKKKMSVIYNGVVLEDNQINKLPFDLPQGRMRLCMIANLQMNKDHLTLLKSLSYLKNDIHYSNLPVLLLAGYKGDTFESLNRYVEIEKLTGDVRFLGKIEDTVTLLSNIDIAILSSKSEGCSNSLIEAMLSQCPIIATNIPSIRDMVSERGRSVLFEVGNYIELAYKIVDLIENEQYRIEIKNANYEKANSLYTVEKLVCQTSEVFDTLLM